MDAFTATAIGLIVIWVILAPRAARKIRQGDEEWRKAWGALDPARRKAITQKMRRGDPIDDPADAELGLRAIVQVDHVKDAMRLTSVLGTLVLGLLLIGGIVEDEPVRVLIAGAGLALSTLMAGLSWLRQRQRQLAAERTVALHPELGRVLQK